MTNDLPQLNHSLFVTDAGLETVMVFEKGLNLPEFASFVMLEDVLQTELLRQYYEQYVVIAHAYNAGLILEAPTWRANRDWGQKIGYSETALAEINKRAIAFLQDIRTEFETAQSPMVVSGCVGPRGDGYNPTSQMDADTAEQYHTPQIAAFKAAGADMVNAMTITYPEEAIGIARVATTLGIPAAISFTVETDGNLPCGTSLQAAIEKVDRKTNRTPVYYMINCAHPTHFRSVLTADAAWTNRIYGLRANASRKSHAELDESETLDSGNPRALGSEYAELKKQLRNLTILGGCCGTDNRHVEAICKAYI
ncbi:MAG: homocysteine S-methyltransferase family protein, partial [Phormidesmis sp.]